MTAATNPCKETPYQIAGVLNPDIFQPISFSLTGSPLFTPEVIIIGSRIDHVEDHHPGDYENYKSYIACMLSDPEWILKNRTDNPPFRIVLLNKFLEGEELLHFRLILRLKANSDPLGYLNSIITFWHTNATEYGRLIRQARRENRILYERTDS